MDNSIYATFLIPGERLEGLEKLFKKLARKIEKGKTSAEIPVIEATRSEVLIENNGQLVKYKVCKHSPEDQDHSFYDYVWVTIKYEQPKLNGWQLVAVYDWEITADDKTTCYMSVVPGHMVPDEYREVNPGECEHCNLTRRRKQSMLLVKVTDGVTEYRVVGTSCIKDFLGHHNPKTLMEVFSLESTIHEWAGYGGASSSYKRAMDSVLEVLTVTAMYTRMNGYVRAGEWGDRIPTAHSVNNYMHSQDRYWVEERDANKPTDADRTKAQQAFDWGLEQAKEDDSEYWHNMGNALNAGAITGKRFGLVCSLMYSFFIAEEKRLRENRLSEKANLYLGEPGERLKDIEATVVRVRPSDGFYGPQTIITLETPDGNTLTWFATGSLDVEAGDYWKLTGTVKKHTEYKGVRQTQLTRVKYADIDAKEQAA